MSGGTSSDIFIPQVATDAIAEGLRGTGAIVLYNSPAVVVNNTLGAQGQMKPGRKLTIPYFGHLGEMIENVPEGVGVEPFKPGPESVEEAAIEQACLPIEWSMWEQMVLRGRQLNLDPYLLMAQQATARMNQMFEKRLVKVAAASLDSGYINDVTAASKTLDWDVMADTRYLLGDIVGDIALMSAHSKVKKDLIKIKDSVNRPLFVDSYAQGEIPRFQGVPVYMSDLNTKSSDDTPKYDTLLLQAGALALWHSMPFFKVEDDARANMTSLYLWVYYIPYRYNKLPGKNKGGVLIARTI